MKPIHMRQAFILTFLFFFYQVEAQQPNPEQDSYKQNYLAEGRIIGKKFTDDFYPNYDKIHALPEKSFVAKIDSVRQKYLFVLNKFKGKLDTNYYNQQQIEIKYYFDKLLIEYPVNHEIYTGTPSFASSIIPNKLKRNLVDFNKPELLSNSDFTDYAKAFLSFQVSLELKKPVYKNTDNQQLRAVWKLIPEFISNAKCTAFWKSYYLQNHINNDGTKNIQTIYTDFKSTCKDTGYLNAVTAAYKADSIGKLGHVIKTYKTFGPFSLNIHIFLPDSNTNNKRPTIVYFHGGSWSEGKPDWFFADCKEDAKKGWVACAVEYRTYGMYGTLPFAAVMDAKSAIRWLRQHAPDYNIDTNRIVASGNSAGGHLTLCTALVGNWNEKTDDLNFSPVPNVLLVNSGVYDLTDRNTAWVRKDLKDKNLVKEISPDYLIKKNLPPTLIIHGTNDQSVPYETAKKFVNESINIENDKIEFQSLDGAGHFIWFDPKYASEVSKLRSEFLARLGY